MKHAHSLPFPLSFSLPLSLPFLLLSLFLLLLPQLPSVSAHGYLSALTIDGQLYKGNIPATTNFASPIRAVTDIVPVKGAMNRDINCGIKAAPAGMVVPAMPGSEVMFTWAAGDNGLWRHNTGPMLTYMANCGNTTCDQFDPINAEWFKIDSLGKHDDGSTWYQADITLGGSYTTHLPNTLSAGDYLLRHEIIALQLAQSPGGAEFYPSCSQIRVSGTQTGVPDADSLVSFPGAYSDSDPGILDPTVYNPGASYTMPGPEVDGCLEGTGVGVTMGAQNSRKARRRVRFARGGEVEMA